MARPQLRASWLSPIVSFRERPPCLSPLKGLLELDMNARAYASRDEDPFPLPLLLTQSGPAERCVDQRRHAQESFV